MPGLFGASAAVMRVCRLPDLTPPARLRADARGRDGGVREELAQGVGPNTQVD
jgi:hypothetical protein